VVQRFYGAQYGLNHGVRAMNLWNRHHGLVAIFYRIESFMERRTLIYLPIIHTRQDMGDLGESIRQATVRLLGKQSLKQKDQMVDRIWTAIEQAIDALDLAFEKVRLYQDGLPVCGREMEIIADLADAGSRNHCLLMQLTRKGAVLMGTESAELLLEEYRLIKQTVSGQRVATGAGTPRDRHMGADILLKKRDQFIAQRINGTLVPDETGIIFLGMLHDLQGQLDKDIKVVYPISRLSLQRGIKK
jgi:hypothetical protein